MKQPRQIQTGALPLAQLPVALKILGSGWTWMAVVGAFFGVKLFFADMKIDDLRDDKAQLTEDLGIEKARTAALEINVDSLSNQTARKEADDEAKDEAKDELDDIPETFLAPPSIKRAIGILRDNQDEADSDARDRDGGEPDVRRRARGTTPRGE